jgi:cell division protein FtsA
MPHSKILNGIDLGTTKVTTIIGQYFENEDRLNILAVSSIPAQGFRKGQIVDIDQATKTIIQSIEAAERMAGFQINNAFVSISAPYIESLNSKGVVAVSNPSLEITQTDITRAIDSAKTISLPPGKEILHVIPRTFSVDGQEGIIDPVGMNGQRLEIETHIILASSPAIKNLQKCLEEVGIRVDQMVYSGLSCAKAALTNTEKELGVALIDMGGTNTSVTLFCESSPVYSTVIPIGANNITNDLAIGMRFTIDDAEKLKIRLAKIAETKKYEDEIDITNLGIAGPSNKISLQTAVTGIIKPRLEEIFDLIETKIDESGYKTLIPAGIVLTGGGAMTINAAEVAQKVIPTPLRIASPPKVGGIVDDILNPCYTSAVGLLLYAKDEKSIPSQSSGTKRINFGGVFGRIKNLLEPLLP